MIIDSLKPNDIILKSGFAKTKLQPKHCWNSLRAWIMTSMLAPGMDAHVGTVAVSSSDEMSRTPKSCMHGGLRVYT